MTQSTKAAGPGAGVLLARGVWLVFALANFGIFCLSVSQFLGPAVEPPPPARR